MLILKFIWKFKEPRIVKTILEKKTKVGELTLPNFEAFYQAKIIKTVWYWHRRYIYIYINRIEVRVQK